MVTDGRVSRSAADRSGYRAHELELVVSFRVSDPIALGLDGDCRWFGGDGSHQAAVVRFDYHWEAED
jgi:hypothetical protein